MVRMALIAVAPLTRLLTVSLTAVDFGQYCDDEAMITKVRRALAPPPTLHGLVVPWREAQPVGIAVP